MTYHGTELIFIDTAGLPPPGAIEDGIEFYSSLRTRRAIERSDICILLIDATEGEIQNQDLKIAALAWESRTRADRRREQVGHRREGRQGGGQVREGRGREGAVPLKFVPFLFTSALTGQRVTKVLDVVLQVAEERLNAHSHLGRQRRLEELLARRQPPQAAGREVKLNYATQVEVAPPTIAVFGNNPDLVEEHYIRFPAQRISRDLSVHGKSAAHSDAPQELTCRCCSRCSRRMRWGRSRRRTSRVNRAASICESTARATSGATNVFRVLGAKIGSVVFAFDMAKGAVPVLFFAKWVDPAITANWPGDRARVDRILCGVAAIAGHVRPMWLKFGKGGKGVATAGGVFLALAPLRRCSRSSSLR